ncbi:extracellular solute-binding protein [Peterkaempfera bronchialis]|uniref:Extracellular solute-binding protein n=1 Tax=Peterkaempfera bronchialis TaxID=2126346 RepID=A0A345T3I7_9ACTN|nr:extracellular solute-binding protein [Peterkaempfera bronchialis]AXI80542.1 extracellular solute-binding protein [Peterkaempfera bronchialis]
MTSADRARPDAPAAGPVLGRRTFLGSAAAVAAVAAGGGLLTACTSASGGSPAKGGVATGKALADVLPAYLPSQVVTPDIPGQNGASPGFLTFPAELESSVRGKAGKGGAYTVISPLWGAVPEKGSKYFSALNEAIGADLTFQQQDGNTYQDKIGAVLASDDIADIVVIPGWNLNGRIPDAVSAKFADLGPYLAGDAVKKYPNLAAIPTGAWQMSVFGGKLRGLPMPSSPLGGEIVYYRADVFEKNGYTVPTSPDAFLALAKEITDAKAKVWACDDMWYSAQILFGCVPGTAPNYWQLKDGKLVHLVETPEYLEAMEWTRKLFAAGVVHPDAVAATNDSKTRFTSGQTLMMNDGSAAWYGLTFEQAKPNPEFRIKGMDFFGAQGGDPVLYLGNQAGIFSFLNKKLPKDRIEECLAIADFCAAPFGTKEYLLVQYGVEGVHYTRDSKGTPTKTERGIKEVVSSYEFIASPDKAIAYPDHPEVVRDYCAWMARNAAFAKKPLFFNMQIQEPTRFASLYNSFDDLRKDVHRGRKKMSDVQSAVSDWRRNGGDQLRDFYQQILDRSGSGA